jgi:hypothetical protein
MPQNVLCSTTRPDYQTRVRPAAGSGVVKSSNMYSRQHHTQSKKVYHYRKGIGSFNTT